MTDLKEGLKTLESWVFRKYYDREDKEDLYQEASIAFWQEHEKGKPVTHCFTSAKWRVLNLLSKSSRATLSGQPKRTPGTMITKRGEATRKTVAKYVSEYTQTHRERPTVYRIAKDTGLSEGAVKNALRHVGVKDASTTPRDPQMTYLVDVHEVESDDPHMQNASKELQQAVAVPSHEPGVLDRYLVKKFVLDLKPVDKMFIYLVYWNGLSKSAAASELGFARNRGYDIHTRVMGAISLKALEAKYNGYTN